MGKLALTLLLKTVFRRAVKVYPDPDPTILGRYWVSYIVPDKHLGIFDQYLLGIRPDGFSGNSLKTR